MFVKRKCATMQTDFTELKILNSPFISDLLKASHSDLKAPTSQCRFKAYPHNTKPKPPSPHAPPNNNSFTVPRKQGFIEYKTITARLFDQLHRTE